MERLMHKRATAARRSYRVRTRISHSASRPRLSVNISNAHVTAQVIDDVSSRTLVYSTSVGQKIDGNLSAKAAWVGEDIAKKAKKAKITAIAFDRGRRKYHGRLKALADAARKEGLEF